MQRRHLAWILLPAAIVIIAAVTVVVSSYQKEAGIAVPGKGARATVAAAAEAWDAALGAGAAGYDVFSKSLAVAMVEARNMASTNPAETRLQVLVAKTLDCLSASREAWQTELDQTWDPAFDSLPDYWQTLHPALSGQTSEPLSAEQVRQWSNAGADYWLQQALSLVE